MPTTDANGFRHAWIGRRFLPERYGQPLRILTARNGHFLIEFEDGQKESTVRGTFRKRRPTDAIQKMLF